MEPFRFHLFICSQQKPEGVPSCPSNGSFVLLDALDHELQARGLKSDVQLTTCGCMGLCDEGPVMVVYPDGVWYLDVSERVMYPKSSEPISVTANPSIAWYGTIPLP